jgi:hypothetical protein
MTTATFLILRTYSLRLIERGLWRELILASPMRVRSSLVLLVVEMEPLKLELALLSLLLLPPPPTDHGVIRQVSISQLQTLLNLPKSTYAITTDNPILLNDDNDDDDNDDDNDDVDNNDALDSLFPPSGRPSEAMAGDPVVDSALANSTDGREKLTSGENVIDGAPSQVAPSSTNHVYDVFAEYEEAFGTRRARRVPQKKNRQASSSLGRVNPARNGSLSLIIPSKELVQDEQWSGRPDQASAGSSTEVGSDSLYTGHLTDMEPDGELGLGQGKQRWQGRSESLSGLEHPSISLETSQGKSEYSSISSSISY